MSRAWRVLMVLATMTAGGTAAALQQPDPPAAAMARAARTFLDTLPAGTRQQAMFPFNGDERLNWQFIPTRANGRPGVVRSGLPFKAMSAAEQDAALALLRIGLSVTGYQKVTNVRALEMVLLEAERDAPYVPPGAQPLTAEQAAAQSPAREPDLYYFQVFGTPSATGTWGWRYEGHHVSVNVTIVNGRLVSSTPQFLGASPAEVRTGPRRGLRTLAKEEDLARSLLHSLTPQQLPKAHISPQAPIRHFTWNHRKASRQEETGITYAELTEPQRKVLWSLIEEYAAAQLPSVAADRLSRIRAAGLDTIKFVWMGETERAPGKGHYYRIQGPTFIIEYDNTQNEANHIHTVWRDFDGDFGVDVLAAHYERDHRFAIAAD